MTSTAVPIEREIHAPALPKAAMLHGWRRTFFRFRQRRVAFVALMVVLLLVLVALLAPYIRPHDPAEQFVCARYSGSSGTCWLGADDLGRDLLSRMMMGLRTSLLAAATSVAIALTAGFIIGTLAGYIGGLVDTVLMRIMDAVLSVPSLLMAAAIVGILGPGLKNAMIGLSITFTPGFARLIRGQTLSTKEEVYVEAARVMGARDTRVVFRHIVPNAMAPILVQAMLVLGLALLAEGALSYLGFSVRSPGSSLGTILQRGFSYKERSTRSIWLPGLTILMLSWSFNTIADGLRDAIGRGELGGGA